MGEGDLGCSKSGAAHIANLPAHVGVRGGGNNKNAKVGKKEKKFTHHLIRKDIEAVTYLPCYTSKDEMIGLSQSHAVSLMDCLHFQNILYSTQN